MLNKVLQQLQSFVFLRPSAPHFAPTLYPTRLLLSYKAPDLRVHPMTTSVINRATDWALQSNWSSCRADPLSDINKLELSSVAPNQTRNITWTVSLTRKTNKCSPPRRQACALNLHAKKSILNLLTSSLRSFHFCSN